jgi:hypothetical protein
MEGYVYVLINPAFPDLVKIGRTTKDPKIRAAELSATGTPDKFVVAHQILVKDAVRVFRKVISAKWLIDLFKLEVFSYVVSTPKLPPL